jgi:Xaa-Pro dipeptidase
VSVADRIGAALELTAAAGAEVLVCADPANVHWLGGVAVEIETGPSPFAPPPLLVLAPDSPPRLIAAAGDVPDSPPDALRVVAYEGFTTGELLGPARAWAALTKEIAGRQVAGDSMLVGGLLDSPAGYLDVGGELRCARAVKDAEALEALRCSLAATDAGQAAARDACVAGAGEVEVLVRAREAMEILAGQRVPLLADLVGGPRSAAGGGAPSSRSLRDGELVLCDLAPRLRGTWGDSCATFAVGEVSAEIRAAHGRVEAALERAMEAVRPGARADAVDAVARQGLDYPHHTGHGIGSSYYEEPRLVPGEEVQLREGMVIALEPGFYAEDFGIRLEHVVRVTQDGCEDLSGHRLEL